MSPFEVVEDREIPGLGRLYVANSRSAAGEERLVEFVDAVDPGIPKTRKWVITISTQYGCVVGCSFCDAGSLGFRGNLSAGEMAEQVLRVARDNPDLDPRRHPRIKVHFARMGEPSLNPEVLRALKLLSCVGWPGLMPSVSTVAPQTPAVEPFFEGLLAVKEEHYRGRFQLQFSLHGTGPESRRRVVPVRTWSLEEIAAYGRRFVRAGDRKVTLNFALDGREAPDPGPVLRAFDPGLFLVKITPVNPTTRSAAQGFAPPWSVPPESVAAFARALKEGGFETLTSPPAESELRSGSSCGQLWSSTLRERGLALDRSRRRTASAYVGPDSLEGKAAAWDGGVAAFRRRDLPGRAEALLVVDMQNLFLEATSGAFLPEARAVFPNVYRLAKAFRDSGRPVLCCVHADPGGGEMARWWDTPCRPGSWEARLYRPLASLATGTILEKRRYSAFHGTDLEARLRALGASSIVVAGVTTNLCVDATARDAFMRDFAVAVPLDATAAHREELHLSALKSLAWGVAAVETTDRLLGSYVAEECLSP